MKDSVTDNFAIQRHSALKTDQLKSLFSHWLFEKTSSKVFEIISSTKKKINSMFKRNLCCTKKKVIISFGFAVKRKIFKFFLPTETLIVCLRVLQKLI